MFGAGSDALARRGILVLGQGRRDFSWGARSPKSYSSGSCHCLASFYTLRFVIKPPFTGVSGTPGFVPALGGSSMRSALISVAPTSERKP